MWCELETIELRTDTCPIACIYRAQNGECGYAELTDDEVDAATIGRLSGKKVYKIKSLAAASKQLIEIGLAIDRYSDYIRDTVPRAAPGTELNNIVTQTIPSAPNIRLETVNANESSGVSVRLKRGFNLTDHQEEQFWSEERFSKWSKRSGSSVTLRDMRQALVSI